MKTLLAILSLLAISAAAPPNQHFAINKQELNVNPDGTHNYVYETANGIYEDQHGYPKGPELQAVQGQFQYVSPEGLLFHLRYIADENGFQPQGEHLPTPPPIPIAIQKSLEYLARLPQQNRKDQR